MSQYTDQDDSIRPRPQTDQHPDRLSRSVEDLERKVADFESKLYRVETENRRLQRTLQRLANDVDALRTGLINRRG